MHTCTTHTGVRVHTRNPFTPMYTHTYPPAHTLMPAQAQLQTETLVHKHRCTNIFPGLHKHVGAQIHIQTYMLDSSPICTNRSECMCHTGLCVPISRCTHI